VRDIVQEELIQVLPNTSKEMYQRDLKNRSIYMNRPIK